MQYILYLLFNYSSRVVINISLKENQVLLLFLPKLEKTNQGMIEINQRTMGNQRKRKKVSSRTDPTLLCPHAIPHVTTSFTKPPTNPISPRVLRR